MCFLKRLCVAVCHFCGPRILLENWSRLCSGRQSETPLSQEGAGTISSLESPHRVSKCSRPSSVFELLAVVIYLNACASDLHRGVELPCLGWALAFPKLRMLPCPLDLNTCNPQKVFAFGLCLPGIVQTLSFHKQSPPPNRFVQCP